MTSVPSSELRDRIAAALATPMGSYTWETKADAVLAVVQPELDRLRAELEQARAAAFREAARVLEDTGRDDDAVNLLDNIADGITAHTQPST